MNNTAAGAAAAAAQAGIAATVTGAVQSAGIATVATVGVTATAAVTVATVAAVSAITGAGFMAAGKHPKSSNWTPLVSPIKWVAKLTIVFWGASCFVYSWEQFHINWYM